MHLPLRMRRVPVARRRQKEDSVSSPVVFVDTETISLDPEIPDVIWEVGLITPDGAEHQWSLPVDLGLADPRALEIGRFYERYPKYGDIPGTTHRWHFARQFEALTRGCHLAGAVVSFDEERLRKLLRRSGAAPGWSHRLICVETLAAGKLGVMPDGLRKMAERFGITISDDDRHTALGDARLSKAVYDAVMA